MLLFLIALEIISASPSASDVVTPAERTITLSRGVGPTSAGHSIDPTDELDFVINLSPLLETGEQFTSVVLYTLPTAEVQGFEIPATGEYAASEIDHAHVLFWPRIDLAEQTSSAWSGQGTSCGFEVTAQTDSIPPRVWQRTVLIRVVNK